MRKLNKHSTMTCERVNIQFLGLNSKLCSITVNEYSKLLVDCIKLLLIYIQTYPPNERSILHGKPSDYEHADEFVKSNGSKAVGTLSRPEWEAACKYLFMYIYLYYKMSKLHETITRNRLP